MAKHTLNTGGDELEFSLLGISSADDQYRVVSLINDALNTDLALSSYVPMQLRKGELFTFSLYSFEDESLGIEYNLIPNQSNLEPPGTEGGGGLFAGLDVDQSTRLIKELPEINYFLIVKGDAHAHHAYELLSLLRTGTRFPRVQLIEHQSLQSKKNLIF